MTKPNLIHRQDQRRSSLPHHRKLASRCTAERSGARKADARTSYRVSLKERIVQARSFFALGEILGARLTHRAKTPATLEGRRSTPNRDHGRPRALLRYLPDTLTRRRPISGLSCRLRSSRPGICATSDGFERKASCGRSSFSAVAVLRFFPQRKNTTTPALLPPAGKKIEKTTEMLLRFFSVTPRSRPPTRRTHLVRTLKGD